MIMMLLINARVLLMKQDPLDKRDYANILYHVVEGMIYFGLALSTMPISKKAVGNQKAD